MCSEHLNNYMARRPNKHDVVLGIRGWKLDYGKAGDYPRTVAATQFEAIPNMPEVAWETLDKTTSALETVFNRDGIENPAAGKQVLTDPMYAIMLFFKSRYVASLITQTKNKYKKYFLTNPAIPVGYDTVYLIQYLDFNTVQYPELTDVSFCIGTPMVGEGKPYFTMETLAGGRR